ncbi:MAG TPA: glutathione synthase [Burkholderiales bacterium]|nr:glutathione synthase [Burkholderiales bacterium]
MNNSSLLIHKKILFICDPLDSFKIKTDTTYFLMLTASELNYSIFYCYPQDIYADNEIIKANVIKIQITKKSQINWYEEQSKNILHHLDYFNAVFVRNDPPFNMEYYYLTQLLTLAEEQGVKVLNNSNSLRNFNEKLSILNFPQLITPTTITKNKNVIIEFLNKHEECVIKPLDEMAGRSVFKISINDFNKNTIIETITNYFTKTIMLQKFIPEVKHGDKRIFIVNGQVIDMCLLRIPPKMQIRSNIALGGTGEVQKISKEDFNLSNTVAQWLIKKNIVFAGLDVIGNYLNEINITSPTGTQQIFENSGINIPKLLLENI